MCFCMSRCPESAASSKGGQPKRSDSCRNATGSLLHSQVTQLHGRRSNNSVAPKKETGLNRKHKNLKRRKQGQNEPGRDITVSLFLHVWWLCTPVSFAVLSCYSIWELAHNQVGMGTFPPMVSSHNAPVASGYINIQIHNRKGNGQKRQVE